MSDCCPPTTDPIEDPQATEEAEPLEGEWTPSHSEQATDLEQHAARNLQVATSGKDLDGQDVAEGMRLFALAAAQGQAAVAQSHRLADIAAALREAPPSLDVANGDVVQHIYGTSVMPCAGAPVAVDV